MSAHGKPPVTENDEHEQIKYMNLHFVESEDSGQVKDADSASSRRTTNNEQRVSRPSKILPTPLLNFTNGVPLLVTGDPDPMMKEKSLSEMGFESNEITGWENIIQPRKESLYKLLRNMIDNHIKPNVQIRIGGVTFNCHMMVLQCYSEFFLECNNEVLIQLPEEKITPGAFMMIYDWMLADEPLVQREGILELFNAANFLGIKELVNQCWLCLDDDMRFSEDTAFMLYLEARKYDLENLEQLMLTRVCRFFLTLVASKDFLELKAKEVITLLSSNSVGVNSEIEIFMTMVRWMNHDWEKRKEYVIEMAECIRFSLMPPWFLVTLSKANDCPEIERISCNEEVKKMINDGISFTTTQLYYGENRDEFLHFLERYKLVTPMPRQWIFDKDCHYHHRLDCPNMQYITFKSFLEYLEMIQQSGKNYWRTVIMAKNCDMPYLYCCSARSDMQKDIPTKNGMNQSNREASNNDEPNDEANEVGKLETEQTLNTNRLQPTLNNTDGNRHRELDSVVYEPTPKIEIMESTTSTTNGASAAYSLHELKTLWLHKRKPTRIERFNLSITRSTSEAVDMETTIQCPPSSANSDDRTDTDTTKMNFSDSISTLTQDGQFERNRLAKVSNKKILIFGGYDPFRNQSVFSTSSILCDTQVLYFDDNKMDWRQLSMIPTGARKHHVTVQCNGLIYIIGGTRITPPGFREHIEFEKTIYSFDPLTGIWNFECRIPEVRRDFGAIAIDNENCAKCCSIKVSDPCDVSMGTTPRTGSHGMGFFIIGGEGVNGEALSSVWFYDVLAKTWAKKAPLNVGRYGFAATLVDNEIWIVGGITNHRMKKTNADSRAVDSDLSDDGFIQINRYGAQTTAVISDTVEYYNLKCSEGRCPLVDSVLSGNGISTKVAKKKGSRKSPRTIKDGACGDATPSLCGFCDVENGGVWRKSKIHLTRPRAFSRLCRMPTKQPQVLLTGGISIDSGDQLISLDTVEQFNFYDRKWEISGKIREARHGHSMAVLDETHVIMLGGVSTVHKRALSSVEQYSTIANENPMPDFPPLPSGHSGGSLVIFD